LHILVAENDFNYRTVLCEALRMDGHTVLTANDGVEAYEILQKSQVELIVSDINMPNRTGSQLHWLVRNDKRLGGIPFIYITGFAILRMATPLDETGLDYMVSKVQFERLLQLIDELC